jgi:hypothetical protein
VMSPQSATTKPAPADRLTSRTGTTWPVGAPRRVGSTEKDYCVLAMQTGRWPKPAASQAARRARTGASAAMPAAP